MYLYVLMPLLSYSLGAVPFGLIVCLLVKGVDIRECGSKNIGATNAGRVCGWPFFAAAFTLDFAKGLAPVLAGGAIIRMLQADANADALKILYGSLAILGHTFPAYLRFKGGKAVATSFGVFVGLAPAAALIAFGVWAVLVMAFRYVSLASIVAAVCAPAVYAIQHRDDLGGHLPVLLFAVVIALFVVIRHRGNIRRLLSGTESRVPLRKKAG